jgi:hypothetical protein
MWVKTLGNVREKLKRNTRGAGESKRTSSNQVAEGKRIWRWKSATLSFRGLWDDDSMATVVKGGGQSSTGGAVDMFVVYWYNLILNSPGKDTASGMERIFSRAFSAQELQVFRSLRTPYHIQSFLLEIPYSAEECYRSPATVLRDRTAHCFDGALFAAAALRFLGYPPLIMDLLPNERDDDHLLALYKAGGHWGAVAKSNFSGLTYREPIHRTLRELVLSYFEPFYNVSKEKTLRKYTVPLNLRRFDSINWMASDERLDDIGVRLDEIRKVQLITPSMSRRLSPVDERSYNAGLLGANWDGLFKP